MEKIGCIVMASGNSARYGRNKLLEKVGDREVILHTVNQAAAAGLAPLTVTRSSAVNDLLEHSGFPCILHDRPRKSDTIHIGLEKLEADLAGYLFIPGDQPLVLPDTLRRMIRRFYTAPDQAVRLAFSGTAGSPVLFPARFRKDLLSYEGERGGIEVLNRSGAVCTLVSAAYEWELWDADTPENMDQIREIWRQRNPLDQ